MTLQEIKEATEKGMQVYWSNTNYRVIKDNIGHWLIVCTSNNHAIGLTWQDGTTINGKENDFFIIK